MTTADDGEVTIAVLPLKTSPLRVGPTAAALAGRETAGAVGALALATGAAIASVVMTAVARAARLLIGLGRRYLRCVDIDSPKVETFPDACVGHACDRGR
jgi:hypothetical protein